jgi:hypothetical protein
VEPGGIEPQTSSLRMTKYGASAESPTIYG